MSTTIRGHRCAHPQCQVTVPDHMLACGHHWYQLPTPLRNRIWFSWRHADWTAHTDAVREAVRCWTVPERPPPRPDRSERCHSCRTPTDFVDETTGQAVCLTCARAPLHGPGPEQSCVRCGTPSELLVGINTEPKHCPDCTQELVRL